MAIKKGIEPGDVVFKQIVTKKEVHYYQADPVDVHYHLNFVLRSRRARTLGSMIPSECAALMEKLGVRLQKWNSTSQYFGPISHVGVGIDIVQVSEHVYARTPLSPIVKEVYGALSNRNFLFTLQKPVSKLPEPTQSNLESEEINWPEEPEWPW